MMILKSIDELKQWRDAIPSEKSIGFVPTMGCLHKGHVALLDAARAENDVVVLSIYVNPTQFDEASDLARYPTPRDVDLDIARQAQVDAVFMPSDVDMYADEKCFTIDTTHPWSQVAEGAARPGHFTGVLTVVMKLIQAVMPARAYFGQKDYQQGQLIAHMLQAFFMRCEVVLVDTVREQSGLALSSRNGFLNEEQRVCAEQFAAIFHAEKKQSLEELACALRKLPLTLEYLIKKSGRLLVAVRIGEIRLIDNRC